MSDEPGADLVRGYLQRLTAAGWSLPPDRRDELVAEVREHVAEALTVERDRGVGDEVATRTVLERLGPPEDIVRAEVEGARVAYGAAGDPGAYAVPPRSPWGGLEIGAVLALVLVPVLGTLVGLLLAWASPRWTAQQKTVATGLAVLPGLLFFVTVRLNG